MTVITDLLSSLMAEADLSFTPSDRTTDCTEPHVCDGCGQTMPDVDLWAENSDTGEEVWLCGTCGS
jgi:hypothetical protein